MGKGDIKSRRGKIARGSYGTRRQKKRTAAYVPTAKPAKAVKAAVDATEEKPVATKAAAKKPAAKKAASTAKKPAAKKTTAAAAKNPAAKKPAAKK